MDGEARDMDTRLLLEDFPFQEVMPLNPQLYFYSDRKRWLDGR